MIEQNSPTQPAPKSTPTPPLTEKRTVASLVRRIFHGSQRTIYCAECQCTNFETSKTCRRCEVPLAVVLKATKLQVWDQMGKKPESGRQRRARGRK